MHPHPALMAMSKHILPLGRGSSTTPPQHVSMATVNYPAAHRHRHVCRQAAAAVERPRHPAELAQEVVVGIVPVCLGD